MVDSDLALGCSSAAAGLLFKFFTKTLTLIEKSEIFLVSSIAIAS